MYILQNLKNSNKKNALQFLSAFILMFFLFSISSKAEEQTLFGSGEIKSSGYGGVEGKVTSIDGKTGYLLGGKGGWIINSNFSIGAGGYGLISRPEVSHDIVSFPGKIYTDMGYGGLVLEYINNSDDMLHLTANVLIGAGGVVYNDKSWSDMNYSNRNYSSTSSAFFVAEPSIMLDINVTKFMRIGAGVSYRWVSGLDFDQAELKTFGIANPYTSSSLSGLSGNLIFKFGKF